MRRNMSGNLGLYKYLWPGSVYIYIYIYTDTVKPLMMNTSSPRNSDHHFPVPINLHHIISILLKRN